MADFLVLSTGGHYEGPLRAELKVTFVSRKSTNKRIVLSNEGGDIEISIPLAEVDNFLATLIEERNKGLAL